MKKVLLLIFAFVFIFTNTISLANIDKTFEFSAPVVIYDQATNQLLEIILIENNTFQSRAIAKNTKGDVIYDVSYDKSNHSLETKSSKFVSDTQLLPLNFAARSSDIPKYCDGPSSNTFSIPVKVVVGASVISAALIATKLAAVLAAKTGLSIAAIKKVSVASISLVAQDIYSAVTGGNWGKSVHFQNNFICTEMCTWDEGTVCFYGDKLNSIDYLGVY